MDLEAVLLTGGASRRMGQDKASLVVHGEPLADRMVRILTEANIPVTVLGRQPVEGASFLEDAEDYAGPLSALSRFQPQAPLVLVLSCDMPLFDMRIVDLLIDSLGSADAAVPVVGTYRQPLAALYHRSTFEQISSTMVLRGRSMMAWLKSMKVAEVDEQQIISSGLDLRCLMGVNTSEELATLLGSG